jgi:hypothetical protein
MRKIEPTDEQKAFINNNHNSFTDSSIAKLYGVSNTTIFFWRTEILGIRKRKPAPKPVLSKIYFEHDPELATI